MGNLLNHTTPNPGGPVGVQPAPAPAPAVQLPHPQPHVYLYVENGREYYAVNNEAVSPFPCDEVRLRRLSSSPLVAMLMAAAGRG